MIEIKENDVQYFIQTLNVLSNFSFNLSQYSSKSLKRRIEKLLNEYKCDVKSFFVKCNETGVNYQDIVNAITVNTTELFRDYDTWHSIRYRILPKLANKSEINIWHAGCSSGQEVYSMLMLLSEFNMLERTNIIASDLNTDVLNRAKKGEYRFRFNINYLDSFDNVINKDPYNYDINRNVPYDKYFLINKEKDIIKMKSSLLRKTKFVQHNLVKDGNPDFKKYDIILCRNVLIYFNFILQDKIFENFLKHLKYDGFLIIGKHESVPISLKEKFLKNSNYYIKKEKSLKY